MHVTETLANWNETPVIAWLWHLCNIKIVCLVHQSLASLAPTYLTTDIHLVSEYGRRPLSSSTDRTLTVPRTHNRFGDRSFTVAGPRLWNSLPISLRQISSCGQFRRYLKNHLFGIWEITAQCDTWFSVLYKYCYLLTHLHHFHEFRIQTVLGYIHICWYDDVICIYTVIKISKIWKP